MGALSPPMHKNMRLPWVYSVHTSKNLPRQLALARCPWGYGMSADIRARAVSWGIKVRDFHRERNALLLAAFAGDQASVARHRERLDNLAPALNEDDHVQYLYGQVLEIIEAPNPREHALSILESLYPGQPRSVTV